MEKREHLWTQARKVYLWYKLQTSHVATATATATATFDDFTELKDTKAMKFPSVGTLYEILKRWPKKLEEVETRAIQLSDTLRNGGPTPQTGAESSGGQPAPPINPEAIPETGAESSGSLPVPPINPYTTNFQHMEPQLPDCLLLHGFVPQSHVVKRSRGSNSPIVHEEVTELSEGLRRQLDGNRLKFSGPFDFPGNRMTPVDCYRRDRQRYMKNKSKRLITCSTCGHFRDEGVYKDAHIFDEVTSRKLCTVPETDRLGAESRHHGWCYCKNCKLFGNDELFNHVFGQGKPKKFRYDKKTSGGQPAPPVNPEAIPETGAESSGGQPAPPVNPEAIPQTRTESSGSLPAPPINPEAIPQTRAESSGGLPVPPINPEATDFQHMDSPIVHEEVTELSEGLRRQLDEIRLKFSGPINVPGNRMTPVDCYRRDRQRYMNDKPKRLYTCSTCGHFRDEGAYKDAHIFDEVTSRKLCTVPETDRLGAESKHHGWCYCKNCKLFGNEELFNHVFGQGKPKKYWYRKKRKVKQV
jgi:hypothetical protein